MTRILASVALCTLLAGCAGLSINVDVAATYRSDVPIGERKP